MEPWLIGVIAGTAVGLFIALCITFAIINSKKKRKEFFLEMRKRQVQVTMPMNIELHGMNLEYLVGKKGIAVSDIKPMGKMRVDNEVFEVKTIGTIIRTGSKIVVIKIDANQNIYVDYVDKQNRQG